MVIHAKEEDFKCDICDLNFEFLAEYEQHEYDHLHGQKLVINIHELCECSYIGRDIFFSGKIQNLFRLSSNLIFLRFEFSFLLKFTFFSVLTGRQTPISNSLSVIVTKT